MTFPTVAASALGSNTSSTTVDGSISLTAVVKRLLVVWSCSFSNGEGTNATFTSCVFDPGGDDEANLTNVADATGNIISGNGQWRTQFWYLALDDSISSGSYTVRATSSLTRDNIYVNIWQVNGADTSSVYGDAVAGSSFSNAYITATYITTRNNSLCTVGGIHQLGGDPWSVTGDNVLVTGNGALTASVRRNAATSGSGITVQAQADGVAIRTSGGVEILDEIVNIDHIPGATSRRRIGVKILG